MAQKLDKVIDLSDIPGCSVVTVTIRVLTGRDSLAAAERSIGRDGKPNPLVGMLHRSHMIADAITHVDGNEVIAPYLAWEDWNVRTQAFVERAYDLINGVSREEMDRFLAKHGLVPAPTQEPSAQHI